MTDEEFDAKARAFAARSRMLLENWLIEHVPPALAADPRTGEGAAAFVGLMRDFTAFVDEYFPFIDPLVLPWILISTELIDRPPTEEELRSIMPVFARLDDTDETFAKFDRLIEAV